jgi:hypothetical protein
MIPPPHASLLTPPPSTHASLPSAPHPPPMSFEPEMNKFLVLCLCIANNQNKNEHNYCIISSKQKENNYCIISSKQNYQAYTETSSKIK